MSRLRFTSLFLAIFFMVQLTLSGAFAQEPWPRRIEHDHGVLILETAPKRIVSTSPSLTGTLLALDAPLYATAAAARGSDMTDAQGFFKQWAEIAQERGIGLLYRDLSFDIEALMLSDPDLVVVSAVGGDSILPHVSELEALGYPFIVLDYSVNAWEDLAQTLGRATGKEAKANAIIEAYDRRAQDVAEAINIPEGTVTIVSYDFLGSYAVSKPQSAQARVLQKMGFSVVGLSNDLRGVVKRSREFDFISHENLPAAITGDTVFLLAADAADIAAFKADPILANLPAVKNDRVYTLGPTSFRVDYYSGLEIVDSVEKQLIK